MQRNMKKKKKYQLKFRVRVCVGFSSFYFYEIILETSLNINTKVNLYYNFRSLHHLWWLFNDWIWRHVPIHPFS